MSFGFRTPEGSAELNVPDMHTMTVPDSSTYNPYRRHEDLGNKQKRNPTGTNKLKSMFRTSDSNKGAPSRNGINGEQRFDARFKVLLLGNSGVGKTSLIQTLMGQPFNPGTMSTIGIDLAKKIFYVDDNRVQLEIWDTAGQEQYYSIVALHYREAKAFIIVYDVTSPKTFEQIRKYWLHSIDQNMDEPIPVFFAANKADLTTSRIVPEEDGEKLAQQQCAHGYFETSAKSGLNVHDLFQSVAESMISTWGAPKRWYQVDSNGATTTNWPNQYPERPTVNLTTSVEKPTRSQCCITK